MDSSNCFNNMDENLLVQILVRLPSREIFRLKSVCKRWYSLISSDYFVTFFNHRRHDSSLPPIHDPHSSSSSIFIFQFHRGFHIHLFDPWMWTVRGGGHPARLDLSFFPHHERLKIRLRASCADLILCSQRDSNTLFYYVCNVRTKQFFALSPVPFFREKAIGFLCVPASCSICHHGSDNSRCNFMVVRICKVPRDEPVSQYKVQLFSSQEGQWKKTMVVSSPRTLTAWFYGGFLVPYKRMLHWLTSTCVLVYDPYNSPEIFSRAIDLPTYNGIGPHCLGVFQDRLRVTIGSCDDPQGRYAYHIWELEDYNMGEWILVHKIFHDSMYDQAPDFKIEDRGFVQVDGDAFGNTFYGDDAIPYLIVDQPWPTPVSSLSYTTS